MKTEDELMKLTKIKLEEYGRTLGIELDRRKKKEALVGLVLSVQELCIPKKIPVEVVVEKPPVKEENPGMFDWLLKYFW